MYSCVYREFITVVSVGRDELAVRMSSIVMHSNILSVCVCAMALPKFSFSVFLLGILC